jgi:Holliday junction resolvase-like predicted endonuclease
MESLVSTENHSAESKNLFNSNRGLWAENVVCSFLISKNWSIISHRKKYKFGEIDLIVQRGQCIAIIEIKFLHNQWMSFERLNPVQHYKIRKNFVYLSESLFHTQNVKLFLCFVGRSGDIQWVQLSD